MPEIRELMGTVVSKAEAYLREPVGERLWKAYEFARTAHEGQTRANGEPYIFHPVETALILTDYEVDAETLCGALLHDTVEDTGRTLDDVREQFGETVAELVDGVTKLEKISYSSKEEVQAENFRKMFLSMARDIRVVLIKLADRLHNMRTIQYMTEEKQKEKAHETLDIYAPLAHRLGIYRMKWELEDLCLRYIDREAYYELVGAIAQKRTEREQMLAQVIAEIRARIESMGIHGDIDGRPKHFYSIYRKMQTQAKSLDQIYDLFATRVVVDTVADCYAVLGAVHDLYRPMPGRFKDYIAMPKPNQYQSLHTTVFGPKGVPFEVQIRTKDMHRTAEYGIAAHWKYKEGAQGAGGAAAKGKGGKDAKEGEAYDEKLAWLRQLLEWQKEMRDAGEFMESLRNGLVSDEVFLFTHPCDSVTLPAGAEPIDLATNIHSGIGHRMYGAKVNGRIVPLTYELQNGDIVEILTSDKVHGPSRDWLKIVKSSSARSKINQWFKKEMREENIERGKEAFEKELRKLSLTPSQLLARGDVLDPVLRRYSLSSVDDMYSAIGFGGLSAGKVISRLREEYIRYLPEEERTRLGYRLNAQGQLVHVPGATPVPSQIVPAGLAQAGQKATEEALVAAAAAMVTQRPQRRPTNKSGGVVVKGIDNCLVVFSRCCGPVYGDSIVGFITRGKGVAVHRTDCANIRSLLSPSDSTRTPRETEEAARLIEVTWAGESPGAAYKVEMTVLANDRRHLLADISSAIAEEKVSIVAASMKVLKDFTASISMTVEVQGQDQLDRVFGRVKSIRDVIEVHRGH